MKKFNVWILTNSQWETLNQNDEPVWEVTSRSALSEHLAESHKSGTYKIRQVTE